MSLTSNVLFSPMNRFGFHKDLLMKYSPEFKNKDKAPYYIPTRAEVFKMPIHELVPVLKHWFENAPKELRPSQKQKNDVIELLKKRRDAAEITEQIEVIRSIPV